MTPAWPSSSSNRTSRRALDLAHRALVLSHGVFTASGNADELARDPAVMAGYLGHAPQDTPTPHIHDGASVSTLKAMP